MRTPPSPDELHGFHSQLGCEIPRRVFTRVRVAEHEGRARRRSCPRAMDGAAAGQLLPGPEGTLGVRVWRTAAQG